MMRGFSIALVCSLLAGACGVAAQHAADAYHDPADMAEARTALTASHGEQLLTFLQAERFELQIGADRSRFALEAQGWLGGDRHKFWMKFDGEHALDDGDTEQAEIQGLYSRAISAWWDLQIGLRHDVRPTPTRTHAVLGLQGLAPYWFEIDAALFASHKGDAAVRLEAEYQLRLTQRLILQPRLATTLAFSTDTAAGIGSGLSHTDLGLRLRYEIVREFAPYVGVRWERSYGETADLRRAEGAATSDVALVAGLRFWY